MAPTADTGLARRRLACLVTGATGAVGPGVVGKLAETYDVRTLSRRAPEGDVFTVPVTSFVGDVSDREAVARAARGCAVIVHLAALLHIVEAPRALRAEYERINVGGTLAVIAAASAERVSRVVVMSTIAVYGYQPTREGFDEDSVTRPDSLYGETKFAAEQIALAARRADGAPLTTVLRSSAVYGPRVRGNFERLVHALAKRRFIPVGRGCNRRTVVFEGDLAAATALACADERAGGRIYNVSDGTPHTLREIIAAICAGLGRTPPRWHLPVRPVRVALRAASLLDGRPSRMLDKYLEDVAVDATRIQSELGFRPSTNLADGWAATIAEMRRAGRL
jgi:nucleoside-diphosphate-sugar epimerase